MITIINLPKELINNVNIAYSFDFDVIAMVSDVIGLPVSIYVNDKREFITLNTVVVQCKHHFEGNPLAQVTNYAVELTSESISILSDEVTKFVKENSIKKTRRGKKS